MTIHRVIAISLLCAAVAGPALAAPTISDAHYVPHATRSVQPERSSLFDAQNSIEGPALGTSRSCVYQGGPKTGSLICR